MRVGVICPVGPLDHFGYQHHYMTTVRTMAVLGTRVFLYSSTRNRAHVDDLLNAYSNVEYISSEETWFEQSDAGVETFSLEQSERNSNFALSRCREQGLDCAIMVHINQYVPDGSVEPLERVCREMVDARRPFEWLYKKYQLCDRLFHADHRLPWIVNLTLDEPWRIAADSLRSPDRSRRVSIEAGDFRDKDEVAIVDVPLELTVDDLASVRSFTRGYVDLDPDKATYLELGDWLPYYLKKFNEKHRSEEPLDAAGLAIARECRSDFVSRRVLSEYRPPAPPSLSVRLKSLFRRVTSA